MSFEQKSIGIIKKVHVKINQYYMLPAGKGYDCKSFFPSRKLIGGKKTKQKKKKRQGKANIRYNFFFSLRK